MLLYNWVLFFTKEYVFEIISCWYTTDLLGLGSQRYTLVYLQMVYSHNLQYIQTDHTQFYVKKIKNRQKILNEHFFKELQMDKKYMKRSQHH